MMISFLFNFWLILAEHSVLLYNSFHKSQMELKQCHLDTSLWESLYRRERFHLHLALSYKAWLLPLLEVCYLVSVTNSMKLPIQSIFLLSFQWSNLTLAYARSFSDAFIICVSIGIATRFRQLYCRLEAVYDKVSMTLFLNIHTSTYGTFIIIFFSIGNA